MIVAALKVESLPYGFGGGSSRDSIAPVSGNAGGAGAPTPAWGGRFCGNGWPHEKHTAD